jgi:hypothetical protein
MIFICRCGFRGGFFLCEFSCYNKSMNDGEADKNSKVAEMMKERWRKMNEVAEERGHFVTDADGRKHMIYKAQDVVEANKRTFETTADGQRILKEHHNNLEMAAKLRAEQKSAPAQSNAATSPKAKSTGSQKVVTVIFFLVIAAIVIVMLLRKQ